MLRAKLVEIGLVLLEKKIFKGFYHKGIALFWSCDLDYLDVFINTLVPPPIKFSFD